MTHNELIARLADDTKYTRMEIRHLLNTFSKIVQETLMTGRDVQLWGLGTFVNAPAAARPVMDPRTKQQFIRPATRRLKFVPAQKMRYRIKETQKFFEPINTKKRFGIKEE